MIKIDGKKIAKKIISELKKKLAPKKILAAILVGDDKASLAFLRRKEKIAEELEIEFRLHQLDENISQKELEETVQRISNDNRVGGIIVQLPLPAKFDREKILAVLDPKKDVDALSLDSPVEAPVIGVVKVILEDLGISIINKKVVVIGKGLLIGRPIAKWLAAQGVEVKVADSKTKDLKSFLADSDLVITGVGKANLIDPTWLKNGAGIIDFGFPPDIETIKPESLNHLAFYTPTPGGTGPILVAILFSNFYRLNINLLL
ncbi:MAG: bifunctional 5,10-methylenetetrahydrofolate dehydrogenase/5,10-methenyltetrahydrofolate cyclohydrolase [Patescibacteria group bacterium]